MVRHGTLNSLMKSLAWLTYQMSRADTNIVYVCVCEFAALMSQTSIIDGGGQWAVVSGHCYPSHLLVKIHY